MGKKQTFVREEPEKKKRPPKQCKKCKMWMDAAATECGICDTPM